MPDKQQASLRSKGRMRDAQRESTRMLLVDAAIRVFARHGYARSTIEQIVAEAGAVRATFYLHFKSKPDLLPEILARATDAFSEPYTRLAEIVPTADRSLVEAWIREAIRRWTDLEDLLRPVYEAADADPALFRSLFLGDLPGVAAMAETLVRADVVGDVAEAEISAAVLYAPLFHFFRRHLRGEQFNHDLAATVITDAWMNIISGSRKARSATEILSSPHNTASPH